MDSWVLLALWFSLLDNSELVRVCLPKTNARAWHLAFTCTWHAHHVHTHTHMYMYIHAHHVQTGTVRRRNQLSPHTDFLLASSL